MLSSRFMATTSELDRTVLARRGRWLEYFTILWNLIEGLVGIGAGMMAGSISLVGFGIDSFIEVTSGGALLWRMAAETDAARREIQVYENQSYSTPAGSSVIEACSTPCPEDLSANIS